MPPPMITRGWCSRLDMSSTVVWGGADGTSSLDAVGESAMLVVCECKMWSLPEHTESLSALTKFVVR